MVACNAILQNRGVDRGGDLTSLEEISPFFNHIFFNAIKKGLIHPAIPNGI